MLQWNISSVGNSRGGSTWQLPGVNVRDCILVKKSVAEKVHDFIVDLHKANEMSLSTLVHIYKYLHRLTEDFA